LQAVQQADAEAVAEEEDEEEWMLIDRLQELGVNMGDVRISLPLAVHARTQVDRTRTRSRTRAAIRSAH
jgi:hypothetical protein